MKAERFKFLLRVAAIWGFLFAIVIFVIRTARRVLKGVYSAARAVPFQRELHDYEKRFLFVGDSTVEGIGASRPEKSIAGLFADDFPSAHISSHGVRGLKMAGVVHELKQFASEKFDLLVIQAGGNDILRGTKMDDFEKSLRKVVELAEQMAERVVLIHGGDIGASPLFPRPFHLVWRKRTEKIRNVLVRVVQSRTGGKTMYIDVFSETNNREFRRENKKWFAEDGIHPSDLAYELGYKMIREALRESSYKAKDGNVMLRQAQRKFSSEEPKATNREIKGELHHGH